MREGRHKRQYAAPPRAMTARGGALFLRWNKADGAHTRNYCAENKAAGKESPGGKGVNSYRGDLSRCGGKANSSGGRANSSGGRARQTYFSPKTISASLKSFFTNSWSSLGQITSTSPCSATKKPSRPRITARFSAGR